MRTVQCERMRRARVRYLLHAVNAHVGEAALRLGRAGRDAHDGEHRGRQVLRARPPRNVRP